MRSANLSVPLKGFRPYNALIGLNQASGLAGGPDSDHSNQSENNSVVPQVRAALDRFKMEAAREVGVQSLVKENI